MINPRGIIFRISNYSLRDREDRDYVFSSQDVNKKTSPLVIDFGFADSESESGTSALGTTERYLVATSAGRKAVDTNGDKVVNEKDRRVIFENEMGNQVGITISDAMEKVLGLKKYDETKTPSSSLTIEQLQNSYSTKMLELDNDNNPETPRVSVETLWRIRDVSSELTDSNKKWVAITSTGINPFIDFSKLVLKPQGLTLQQGLTLKFLQDIDKDGIDAVQESILGSSDNQEDTDNDGLTDSFEYYGGGTPKAVSTGWNVQITGQKAYRAFSSPARQDSDLDGISDGDEFNHGYEVINVDGIEVTKRKPLDPQNPDTDGDGITDYDEINGYDIKLRIPIEVDSTIRTDIRVSSDPLNPDTDGDTMRDGDERTRGTDPTQDDKEKVLDDDGDGLVNFLETWGWSTGATTQFGLYNEWVTSDPKVKDTDGDGLTDKEEFDDFWLDDKGKKIAKFPTHPRRQDTDSDGLNDSEEVKDKKTSPVYWDTDDDLLGDGFEVKDGWILQLDNRTRVKSEPLKKDTDGDGLYDGDEFLYGTNPDNPDTDGDNAKIGDLLETQLGTNPSKVDQSIMVNIIDIRITGTPDDGPDDDELELKGLIYIGRIGKPFDWIQLIDASVNKDWSQLLKITRSYTLEPGQAPIQLVASSFFDSDASSGNDLFDKAEDSIYYKEPSKISSSEVKRLIMKGDDEISSPSSPVTLEIRYMVSVRDSLETARDSSQTAMLSKRFVRQKTKKTSGTKKS